MCAPRIDVVARAVVRPVPEGHEFGAWRRIEHKIRDCAWGYATVNSELYYTVHVFVSRELTQACGMDMRHETHCRWRSSYWCWTRCRRSTQSRPRRSRRPTDRPWGWWSCSWSPIRPLVPWLAPCVHECGVTMYSIPSNCRRCYCEQVPWPMLQCLRE